LRTPKRRGGPKRKFKRTRCTVKSGNFVAFFTYIILEEEDQRTIKREDKRPEDQRTR
jgi:hypothetical protein